jgi:hypothetical protein
MAGSRARRVALAPLVAVLAACTGTTPPAPVGNGPMSGRESAAQTPTPAPTSTPARRPTPPVVQSSERLRCIDGTSGITPAPRGTPWVNGVWSDGWRGQVAGGEAQAHKPIFWKGFLYVGPAASRWTTLMVVAPADARLYYVPFVLWAPPGGQQHQRLGAEDLSAGRRSVAVEACGEQPLGYTGGITTLGAACVTLSVEAAGRRAERVVLPLGTPC